MNSEPLSIWLKRFKESVVHPKLNDDLVLAFLNYLADLEIFDVITDKEWQLKNNSIDWDETCAKNLLERLDALCLTKKGFAVGFFLRTKDEYILKSISEMTALNTSNKSHSIKNRNIPPIASDLSNLQIVKKVGKQLSPFLEMEKKFLNQLIGKHVSKEDSQLLYRFILEQTMPKSIPLSWQQLSRRRHK